MTLGQRIAAARKSQNLSQEKLGELLGVSRQAVSKWETDAASPDMENLQALSNLFGLSLAQLTDTPPAPQPRKRWPVLLAIALTAIGLLLFLRYAASTPPEPVPSPAPATEFAVQWGENWLTLGRQEENFPFGTDLALTEPEEVYQTDFSVMTGHRADCGGLKLNYMHIAEEQEVVDRITTIVPEYRTPRQVGPGSTKAQVLAAYGDELVYCQKEEVYTLVPHDYFYAWSKMEDGPCAILFYMSEGQVAGMRLEMLYDAGDAYAADMTTRFPLKDGEPDYTGRTQPEQEPQDVNKEVYLAFNRLVTEKSNLTAEEQYALRWTVFSSLSDLSWGAFGALGSTAYPEDTMTALLTWLEEQTPYSESEIFRIQMGCQSNPDGWLADSYAHLLSTALFDDPIAFVKGLAYDGLADCMSQAVSLARYDAELYPIERAEAVQIIEEACQANTFTKSQTQWAQVLLQNLTAAEGTPYDQLPHSPADL